MAWRIIVTLSIGALTVLWFVACTCSSEKAPARNPELGQRLLAALEQKDPATAAALIEQGADLNTAQPGTGYPPYVLAAKNCLLDTVRLLDKKGVDRERATSSGNPVWKSAFLNAAMNGCLDTIRYFVEEKKVDINTRHSFWNETILHKAVQTRNLSLARYALDHGVDATITDNNGRTALVLAEEIGAQEIATLIKEKMTSKK